MAKDVDLSSSEWIDLIFEGKNKDFGAYELRKASAKRHNRAMLVILIVLLVVAVLGLLANTVLKQADARPEDQKRKNRKKRTSALRNSSPKLSPKRFSTL